MLKLGKGSNQVGRKWVLVTSLRKAWAFVWCGVQYFVINGGPWHGISVLCLLLALICQWVFLPITKTVMLFILFLLQHMVQNQMTSAYPYAAQTGIDEYGHPQQVVVTSQPVSVAASAEQAVTFKADSATYPTTTVAANGGVEQQTVRPRSHSVRFNSFIF